MTKTYSHLPHRGFAIAALASALLLTLAACAPTNTSSSESPADSYRSPGDRHKVQVRSEDLSAFERLDARVVADYGSFAIVDLKLDSAAQSAVAALQSAQWVDEFNVVRLNAGPLDTRSPSVQSKRGIARSSGGKQLHLVQFAGPVRQEWFDALRATGAQVVTYIPNNAYLVYADTDKRAQAANLSELQWDGPYERSYKFHPDVFAHPTAAYSIQLVADAAANSQTLRVIDGLKKRETVHQAAALGYLNVIAYVDQSSLDAIAERPDVVSIHPFEEPIRLDERQDMIVSGNVLGSVPSGPGYLDWLAGKGFSQDQFTASGFGVDLSDSGIDNGTTLPNHFGLYGLGNVLGTGRIAYNRLEGTPHFGSTLQGCDGHGTINSHIIAGYNGLSAAPHVDAAGFHHGLGVAPFVKVGSSVIFDPDYFTYPVFEDLMSRAYRDGMRLSSNSWGSTISHSYDSFAQRYDALVRDAQPPQSAVPAPGNQEMTIVFAAGNSGPASTSVSSPSTGKNVFTIGASRNVRPMGAPDGCNIGDSMADNLLEIASFSSRGPVTDGRHKPDLMAPGTHVGGGVFQADGQRADPPANPNGQAGSCFNGDGVCGGTGFSLFFPAGQQWYTASSGTSHSTPAVAGGAALLRQYFLNQGMSPPSPAMTKAYLMSSARYMTGSTANDTLYSNNQGMGLMDLGVAFDGAGRVLRDELDEDLFTATGQTRVFSGGVADSTKPFRVTLAWTDAPGSTTGNPWNNDLDLTVTVGGQTYKGNVFNGAFSTTGGSADRQNNVESVFLPAGVTGPYEVTVTAANINSDGVPENPYPLDQDFALVIFNGCNSIPDVPTGLTASANGEHRIDLQWNPSSASQYRVYRAQVSGGPYSRIATVGDASYSDLTVSGGGTYYYVVRGLDCGESANSNEASAVAQGSCTAAPLFAGLATATSGQGAICGNSLSWAAALPSCGGAIRYSVYRSTQPVFTPSPSNQIATGLTGTTYADSMRLIGGTTYYYIVRASETGSPPMQDDNTVTRSAVPTGPISHVVRFFDDFDTHRPSNASAYWREITAGGSPPQLSIANGCHWHSATHAYKFGASGCGGTLCKQLG